MFLIVLEKCVKIQIERMFVFNYGEFAIIKNVDGKNKEEIVWLKLQ